MGSATERNRGRSSRRVYFTPVQADRIKSGFLDGLAYSGKARWARNILAVGAGEITRAGRQFETNRGGG
ncbi:hypothetical protein [Streptomyces sp. NPDC059262]|uniref:hypothetical protein n=1 Tax=Streptomyces sp. NPDC059262 TaxID=3346797 RepID=UPI0036D19090